MAGGKKNTGPTRAQINADLPPYPTAKVPAGYDGGTTPRSTGMSRPSEIGDMTWDQYRENVSKGITLKGDTNGVVGADLPGRGGQGQNYAAYRSAVEEDGWEDDGEAIAGGFDRGRHDVASVGHGIASGFDRARHDVASVADDIGSFFGLGGGGSAPRRYSRGLENHAEGGSGSVTPNGHGVVAAPNAGAAMRGHIQSAPGTGL